MLWNGLAGFLALGASILPGFSSLSWFGISQLIEGGVDTVNVLKEQSRARAMVQVARTKFASQVAPWEMLTPMVSQPDDLSSAQIHAYLEQTGKRLLTAPIDESNRMVSVQNLITGDSSVAQLNEKYTELEGTETRDRLAEALANEDPAAPDIFQEIYPNGYGGITDPMLGLIQWGADRSISVQYLTAWGGVSPSDVETTIEQHEEVKKFGNLEERTKKVKQELAENDGKVRFRFTAAETEVAVKKIEIEPDDTIGEVIEKVKEGYEFSPLVRIHILSWGKHASNMEMEFAQWIAQASESNLYSLFKRNVFTVMFAQVGMADIVDDLDPQGYYKRLHEIVKDYDSFLAHYIDFSLKNDPSDDFKEIFESVTIYGEGDGLTLRWGDSITYTALEAVLGLRKETFGRWSRGETGSVRRTSIERIYNRVLNFFSRNSLEDGTPSNLVLKLDEFYHKIKDETYNYIKKVIPGTPSFFIAKIEDFIKENEHRLIRSLGYINGESSRDNLDLKDDSHKEYNIHEVIDYDVVDGEWKFIRSKKRVNKFSGSMSQVVLANILGISGGGIQTWRSDRSYPRHESFNTMYDRLSELFGSIKGFIDKFKLFYNIPVASADAIIREEIRNLLVKGGSTMTFADISDVLKTSETTSLKLIKERVYDIFDRYSGTELIDYLGLRGELSSSDIKSLILFFNAYKLYGDSRIVETLYYLTFGYSSVSIGGKVKQVSFQNIKKGINKMGYKLLMNHGMWLTKVMNRGEIHISQIKFLVKCDKGHITSKNWFSARRYHACIKCLSSTSEDITFSMEAAIIGKLKHDLIGEIEVPLFWKTIIGKENWKSFRNSLEGTLGKDYFDNLRYDGYVDFTLGELYNRFKSLNVLKRDERGSVLLKAPGSHKMERIWKETESDGEQHDKSGRGLLAKIAFFSRSKDFKEYLVSIEDDIRDYLESDAFNEMKVRYGDDWKQYSENWQKYLREKCYNLKMVDDFIKGLKGNQFKRLRNIYEIWKTYLNHDEKKEELFSNSDLDPGGNVYQARVPTYGYFGPKNWKIRHDLQVKTVFDGYVKVLYDQYKRRGLINDQMTLHEFSSTYIDYETFARKFYGRDKMFWLSFNEPKESIDDYF